MLGLDADVNSDWKAERSRVDERVEKEAAGDSLEAHTFWSNKSKGSVLARMLDRTWRAALLLEGCRKSLLQIHKVYFPHNEQPNGLAALLERFREGKALKEDLGRSFLLAPSGRLASCAGMWLQRSSTRRASFGSRTQIGRAHV